MKPTQAPVSQQKQNSPHPAQQGLESIRNLLTLAATWTLGVLFEPIRRWFAEDAPRTWLNAVILFLLFALAVALIAFFSLRAKHKAITQLRFDPRRDITPLLRVNEADGAHYCQVCQSGYRGEN